MKQIIFLFLMFTLFSINSFSQPGTLDTRFANNGLFFDTSIKFKCNSSLLQKDGKIILGGRYEEMDGGFFLMRLNNDGTIDSSFASNGVSVNDFAFFEEGRSLAFQPDGKIVAAGSSYLEYFLDEDFNTVYNMNNSLIRYLSDGKTDSSFGENGLVQTDLGGVESTNSVAIQKDGKILVGGSTGELPPSSQSPKFLLVRYHHNGSIDSSFGINGKVTTDFINSNKGFIIKILLLSDGSIIACGNISSVFGEFRGDFAIAKYLPNGDLDESFGIGGKVTTRMNSTGSLLRDAVLLKDGKILTVGVTNNGNEAKKRAVLVQYNPDGSLDESFGNGGKQEIQFTEGASDATCVNIQENEKILFGVFIYKDFGIMSWFGLTRCNADGSLDSTFGTNAKIVENNVLNPYPTNLLSQNDGKIIVTGWDYETFRGISPFAARYYGDPTHPIFSKIRRWIHRNILNFSDANGTASQYNIEQQNSGGGFSTIASLLPNKNNSYSYNISNYTSATANSNFRIKAVYADGSTVYSEVVTEAALMADTKVAISPNPASSIINITLKQDALHDGTIYIYDAMGNLVRSQSFAKQTKLSINISSLRQGHYRVVVNSNGILAESNFLKE